MQSKRDQVQAHRFVVSRLSSAMLRAEPDAPDTPLGRVSRGTVIGMAITALACAAVLIFGLVSPGGSTSWQVNGSLVIGKSTGVRFLYLNGQLVPVLNYASAKLIAGSQLTVQQVAEQSLRGVPRGAPVGIPGAPDALPAANQLGNEDWIACSTLHTTATGSQAPELTLEVGYPGTGIPIGANQGVVVAGPDGIDYLLWQGHRLLMATAHGALGAVSGVASPVPVPASFLDAVPAGPDLAALLVPGMGGPGPVIDGHPTTIGQLFVVSSAGLTQYYSLGANGFVPLSTMGYDLMRADPRTQQLAYAGGAVVAIPLAPSSLPGRIAAAPANITGGLPATPPDLVRVPTDQAVCTQIQPGSGPPVTELTLVDAASVPAGQPAGEPGVVPGCVAADQIAVSPGGGALVSARSATGRSGGAGYLVTDNGVKYPLTPAAVTALGYGSSTPVSLPTPLLDLLPSGPVLDPAIARSSVQPPVVAGPCGT